MLLIFGDGRNLEEELLVSFVFEGRFVELNFYDVLMIVSQIFNIRIELLFIIWMFDNMGNFGFMDGMNFMV